MNMKVDENGCIVIASPVAGMVCEITVKVGKRLKIGDTFIVLEAMKMELPIEADEAGVVKEILVSQGSPVSAGQALMIIELEQG